MLTLTLALLGVALAIGGIAAGMVLLLTHGAAPALVALLVLEMLAALLMPDIPAG